MPEPGRVRTWLIGMALSAVMGPAQAVGGVYKWVDRQGVVHYDDRTFTAERLTRATIARRAVAADASAKAPADFVAEVARQCRDMRARSETYAAASELYGRDPVGNQYRLSRHQTALERARYAHEALRYCQPLAAERLLAEARRSPAQQPLKTAAPPLSDW